LSDFVRVLQTMPETALKEIAFEAVEKALQRLHGSDQAVGKKQPLGDKPGGWGYSAASIAELFRQVEDEIDNAPTYIRVRFGSDAAALASKTVGDLCVHLTKIAQVSDGK